MRQILRWVALVCLLQVALASKPNIVYILFDDVGVSDLFNSTTDQIIPTPYLNSLVNDGILFSNHYVAPACTPTRASLLVRQPHTVYPYN
jgi:arylsulfatase A-like enzyme